MRVFVYEYVCGGAMKESAPSLRVEGWAMLCAVLEDLCNCPRVEVATLLDPATAGTREWPRNLTVYTGRPKSEETDVRKLAGAAQFTLLIAPEFHDILGT